MVRGSQFENCLGSLLGETCTTSCISRLTFGTDFMKFANAAHLGRFLSYPSMASCHPLAARQPRNTVRKCSLCGKAPSQNVVPKAAAAAPESLFEMQIPGSYPRCTERESLRVGIWQFVSNKDSALKKIFFKFIYLFRERQRQHEPGRDREGEGEARGSQAGPTLSAQSPTWGSIPRTMRP